MNEKISILNSLHPIVRIAAAAGLLLLIPFLGRWPWGIFDYLIMGGLIACAGMVYEFLITRIHKKYRLMMGFVVVVVFLLIWAELAVGLFGSPFAGD